MLALLAIGGEAPPRSRLAARLGGFDLVCGADSGLELLADWGLRPDLVVGDMDSLSRPELLQAWPEAVVERAAVDKDESDAELGIAALRARGVSRIVMVGGGGGRLDHLLALRALMARPEAPEEWQPAGAELHRLAAGRSARFEAYPGALVSVFPLGVGARGMRSEGLKWPLEGLRWGLADFGLSNRSLGDSFQVEAGEGDLLVTIDRGED